MNSLVISNILICGGREQQLSRCDRIFLKDFIKRNCEFVESKYVVTLVHGAARGVDTAVNDFESDNCDWLKAIVKPFPADWTAHGNSAGPKRNAKMAEYMNHLKGDGVVIAFPGGTGTANMIKTAVKYNIFVKDMR